MDGITLTGLKARGDPLSNDLFTGMISKSLLYPDRASGRLLFPASFDSYVSPTDQTTSGDPFPMVILLIAQYPGIYQSGPVGLFTAWGR
ncbi:MAG: hypothetical protein LUO89_10960 [Methanothrix sp.]|nr:hypothetical protein [Methanothrix sp.]